jgi:hypothetical protein
MALARFQGYGSGWARVDGGNLAYDVFISYSSYDKQTADAACAVLESKHIRCWIAPRDILPGSDWGAAIVDGIAGAKVFLLVFSSHANASHQIKREVERAVSHGIPIIPLRIEDVAPSKSLEYFISTPHWLDAFSPPLQKHLEYLSAVIDQLLHGATSPSDDHRQDVSRLGRSAASRNQLVIGASVAVACLAAGSVFVLAWVNSQHPPPVATPESRSATAAAAPHIASQVGGEWQFSGVSCDDGPILITVSGDQLNVHSSGGDETLSITSQSADSLVGIGQDGRHVYTLAGSKLTVTEPKGRLELTRCVGS